MTNPLYIDLFIDPNPNVPEGCGQRFKALDAPRAVSRVRYDSQVCQITGWSSAAGGSACPALAVGVEDSGGGTALLIYGGDWGLRLTPGGSGAPFGEPYLLLDASAVFF